MSRLHLGVFYTGVGPQLVWTDPAFSQHTHIDTFIQVAQTLFTLFQRNLNLLALMDVAHGDSNAAISGRVGILLDPATAQT